MRIGIDIRELETGTLTGIGRYLCNFLEYAAKNDQANQYILFGNQKTRYKIGAENFNVKIIPEFFRFFWDQLILPWQIRKEEIELFYSPYYKGPVLTSAKLVITIHDILPLLVRENSWVKAIALRPWYWMMAKRAARIITVSQSSKEQISKFLKIPAAKIEVVYNSVGKCFKPLPKEQCLAAVKERWSLDKDFILFVGNLKPHKNLSRLIQAYAVLAQELKDNYQLVICGTKGNCYPKLWRLVKTKALEKYVRFLDFVEDEGLLYLYNAAAVFISPSLYEGFGLPALEAMACGTVVIVSNIAALAEVVGEAAVLINPYKVDEIKQALTKILTDSILSSSLIEKALQQSKKFPLNASAEQILRTFKETNDAS